MSKGNFEVLFLKSYNEQNLKLSKARREELKERWNEKRDRPRENRNGGL